MPSSAMPASTKIHIDDVRIQEIKELVPPAHVLREFPATAKSAVHTSRKPSSGSPIA